MGSRYSFTSSQLQFVTGLPKFEQRFSGLLVIAGTNYQPSRADLIRDPRPPPLRGQLVPFPFHVHIGACDWVFCHFTNFFTLSRSSCLFPFPPSSHTNTLSLSFASWYCFTQHCFLGDWSHCTGAPITCAAFQFHVRGHLRCCFWSRGTEWAGDLLIL